MSFSHEYNLPVFIGTGSVLTSGDTSNLTKGQLGIFDSKTYHVASGPVNKRQGLIVAGGSWHTKDKLNKFWGGLQESDKSIDFLGNDIFEFHRSLPRQAQSEQWVLGWDGVSSDTLSFVQGGNYNFRLRIWGEDVYGTFLRPIDRFIQIKADCETTGECVDGCPEPAAGKVYAKRIADIINNDPEFMYFVKAEVISSDMLPTTPTHSLWDLQVCDNGDAVALAAIQNAYPTKQVNRVSRVGSVSTYEFCDANSNGTPSAFTPIVGVSLQVCGVCPSGYTQVAAKDVYVVQRVVTAGTDLTTPTAQQTFATTVSTAYSGLAGKYLSVTGGVASVEVSFTAGATVAAIGSDLVRKVRTESAICVPPAGSSIAWVKVGDRYKTSQTLTLTLEKVCNSQNRLADVQAFYANNPEVVPNSVVLYQSGTCNDVYRIQQYNNACLQDDCLSEAIPQFDELQSFEGFSWTPVDTDPGDVDPSVKVGIRLTAAYEDTKFGGCSFSPLDYYSVRPLKLEIYQFDDSGIACANQVPSRKVRNSSMATQSGEWVIRQFINANKYKAYAQFYHDPRMREALDAQLHEVVDRLKNYKIYFLKVKQNRGYLNHQGDFSPEIYEMQFCFPVEVDTTAFEQAFEQVTSQFGVYLQDR